MKRAPALVSAAALAAVLSVTTTAAAPPNQEPAAPSAGEYCAVRIEPLASGVDPATPVCFRTPDELRAYLAVVTAPRGTSALAAATTASTVLGTVYKDAGYAGGSLSFYGSGSCAGVTFGFAALDAGWRNVISSAKAFAGCHVSLYSAPSYGGSQLLCTPNCASLGALNDRVLSLVFRPAG
ncbi:hypothetical protein P5G50_00530 [Leifsonia sp. F6_8S_P_1B]|uniref:Uncharacterized protein n=1 Tax=Leifsonia williamsii TaxID=3035919 RepID=A0ABT8K650_9MICO|nr:hypothetical protein [Leifsonia williamsii]MDN4612920.1 hypothetical protein [Leifsonia williamsii]